MKLAFILLALMLASSAFAQKHMVEFNANSILMGSFSFTSSKRSGASDEEDKLAMLYLNYAYTVTSNVQAGFSGNYFRSRSADSSIWESYELLVGAIYNLDTDLRNSVYVSAYGGYSWDHSYEAEFANSHDKYLVGRLAVGKRFQLSFMGLDNVTYSPELAYISKNAKSSDNDEWEQEFAIKYLQFSVLF